MSLEDLKAKRAKWDDASDATLRNIEKLETKANKTKEENAYLQKLLLTERKLRKLN